jgi:hypothetical protein
MSGPFLMIVDHDRTGPLYFGPFRSRGMAERAIRRVERLAPAADWSLESLQPGSHAAEWCRIIAEGQGSGAIGEAWRRYAAAARDMSRVDGGQVAGRVRGRLAYDLAAVCSEHGTAEAAELDAERAA